MLAELITYLTTPCPQYVRHMDYLYEAIAMRGRYWRNRESWRPHLENTRGFILSAAEQCRDRSKIVILGSGLLLDVPIEELSSLFREVVLMDIVFLPEVRGRAKRYPRVKLVQYDVTNMAEKLHGTVHRGLRELPSAVPVIPEIDERTGLVVSLNILSQLWVVPRAYALKKMPGLDEELVDDWCGEIVESHYAFLSSLPCPVCLVADHEFIRRDRGGKIVSQDSTVYRLELPEPDASWTWDIEPIGENGRYFSKELNVGAWYFSGLNAEDRR